MCIEIQRAIAHRNHEFSERRIELKIGVHIGDVVHRAGDVYGDGVNIARALSRWLVRAEFVYPWMSSARFVMRWRHGLRNSRHRPKEHFGADGFISHRSAMGKRNAATVGTQKRDVRHRRSIPVGCLSRCAIADCDRGVVSGQSLQDVVASELSA